MKNVKWAMIIMLMVGVASCNSKKSIEGKWTLASIGEITMPEGQEGMAEMAKGFMDQLIGNMHMEFKEDGTFEVSMMMMGKEKKDSGTYVASEGKLTTLTGEDEVEEEIDYKIENGKLHFTQQDDSGSFELIFERSKEE